MDLSLSTVRSSLVDQCRQCELFARVSLCPDESHPLLTLVFPLSLAITFQVNMSVPTYKAHDTRNSRCLADLRLSRSICEPLEMIHPI